MTRAYCFHSDRLTTALNRYAVRIARDLRMNAGLSREQATREAAQEASSARQFLTSPEAIDMLTVKYHVTPSDLPPGDS